LLLVVNEDRIFCNITIQCMQAGETRFTGTYILIRDCGDGRRLSAGIETRLSSNGLEVTSFRLHVHSQY